MLQKGLAIHSNGLLHLTDQYPLEGNSDLYHPRRQGRKGKEDLSIHQRIWKKGGFPLTLSSHSGGVQGTITRWGIQVDGELGFTLLLCLWHSVYGRGRHGNGREQEEDVGDVGDVEDVEEEEEGEEEEEEEEDV